MLRSNKLLAGEQLNEIKHFNSDLMHCERKAKTTKGQLPQRQNTQGLHLMECYRGLVTFLRDFNNNFGDLAYVSPQE